MSNSLIPVTALNQLPAYLQSGAMGYQDEGLSAGVQVSAPKIGITIGKQFTITKNGAVQILPPDANNRNVLRGVLIAASDTLTKAWYEKEYVPGSTEAPDCFSNDGRIPAAGVAKPQCHSCSMCPKNAFGSSKNGRGKACSDRKMVVFVWEGDPENFYTWNVPTMSLQGLAKLNSELKSHNIPLQSVMVELSFDPAVIYAKVNIGAVGFLPQELAMTYKEWAAREDVRNALREVEYGEQEEAAPATQEQVVPNTVVNFGQTTGNTQPDPAAAQQQPAATQQTPPAQQESPKRKRATKAEMEARRAAEALAAAGNQPMAQQAPQQTMQETVAVDPNAAQIAALQAQLAALQGGNKPAVEGAGNTSILQTPATGQQYQDQPAAAQVNGSQMFQNQTGQTNAVPQAGYTTGAQAMAQAQQPEGAAGAPSDVVLGLLNKWGSR